MIKTLANWGYYGKSRSWNDFIGWVFRFYAGTSGFMVSNAEVLKILSLPKDFVRNFIEFENNRNSVEYAYA